MTVCLPIDIEKEVYSRVEAWRSAVEGQEAEIKRLRDVIGRLRVSNDALRAHVSNLERCLAAAENKGA